MAVRLTLELDFLLPPQRFADPTRFISLTQRRNIACSRPRLASAIDNNNQLASKGGFQTSRNAPSGGKKPGAWDDLTNLFKPLQFESRALRPLKQQSATKEPYHLNVYAHKHNIHITWTKPNREPIISKSAGNLNFKKAHRGKYDAAYQLTTFMMTKMQEKGLTDMMGRFGDSNGIELIFRGFGPGREAFTKALMSPEGRVLREHISRVTDATRLKFGGTRSRNVRRL